MYVVVATNHDTKKIEYTEHVSIKHAFSEKRIKENRGEVAMVFNKTFPSGTEDIIETMKQHLLFYTLDINIMLNLLDRIHAIEKSVI